MNLPKTSELQAIIGSGDIIPGLSGLFPSQDFDEGFQAGFDLPFVRLLISGV
jgi:hypothetical protein